MPSSRKQARCKAAGTVVFLVVLLAGGCVRDQGGDQRSAGGGASGEDGSTASSDPRPPGWRKIKNSPLSGRSHHSAVWTGDEMLIWGGGQEGTGLLDDGAAFRPSTGTWRRLPPAPIEARSNHFAFWTGREMLVWGGSGSGIGAALGGEADFPNGASYSTESNTWRRMRTFPLLPRAQMAVAWSGGRLVIWGGKEAGRPNDGGLADGAVYSPTGDEWIVMKEGPLDGRVHPSIAPIGDRVLIVGGTRVGDGSRLDGAIYDPSGASWAAIRPAPRPIDCRAPCPPGIWTGREAIFSAANLAYDPAADQWRSLPECQSAGEGVAAQAAVWSGAHLLVWGGLEAHGEPVPPAGYDPGSDHWAVLQGAPLRPWRNYGAAVWSGTEMIVWGGGSGDGRRHTDHADGAAYRPGASLPATRCPPPQSTYAD